MASNVILRQKYVLSEKDCLRPVIKIVHKYLMPQTLETCNSTYLQYEDINIKNTSENT